MTMLLKWKTNQSTEAQDNHAATFIIGHLEALQTNSESILDKLPPSARTQWSFLLEQASPSTSSDCLSTWLPEATPHQLLIGVLPTHCSRHNTPSHPHEMSALLRASAPKTSFRLFIILNHERDALAASAAIARAFSTYHFKTTTETTEEKKHTVSIEMLHENSWLTNTKDIAIVADNIRFASALVDAPPNELHTDAFLEKILEVSERTKTKCTVIRGKELEEKGFGGLWNVGRAAIHPPALVILEHKPKETASSQTFAWVGKGIVYDTGGLSIKSKTGMPGMKGDMAGAAAVLGAFRAAATMNCPHHLFAVLCLAENSVGSDSLRPDDIISLYSGQTVEVNNTDAEGRLVLGDGVAYATKHLAPDVLIDLATLTGAQLVATGKRHAGLLANDEQWEQRALAAGKESGDLLHPLPYCPEYFLKEFKSQVADMKNSVADRANAQSSCAGHFIEKHLVDFDRTWLHIDFSGPAHNKERATGYGVALLLRLAGLNPTSSDIWEKKKNKV